MPTEDKHLVLVGREREGRGGGEGGGEEEEGRRGGAVQGYIILGLTYMYHFKQ